MSPASPHPSASAQPAGLPPARLQAAADLPVSRRLGALPGLLLRGLVRLLTSLFTAALAGAAVVALATWAAFMLALSVAQPAHAQGRPAAASLADPTRPPAGLALPATGYGQPPALFTLPTRRASPPATPASAPVARAPRLPALQGLARRADGSSIALLDGRWLADGDHLDGGWQLEGITPDGVWVRPPPAPRPGTASATGTTSAAAPAPARTWLPLVPALAGMPVAAPSAAPSAPPSATPSTTPASPVTARTVAAPAGPTARSSAPSSSHSSAPKRP